MRKWAKFIIPIALIYGFAIGAITGSHYKSTGLAMVMGSTFGLIFGTSMWCFVWLLNRWRKRSGIHVDGPVRVARTLRIRTTSSDIRQACASALHSLPKAAPVRQVDADSWATNVGMSWWSFGEVVTAKFAGEAEGAVRVLLTSIPKIKTTVVDYGKNAQNLELLTEALETRFVDKVDADAIVAAEK